MPDRTFNLGRGAARESDRSPPALVGPCEIAGKSVALRAAREGAAAAEKERARSGRGKLGY